MHMTGCWMLTGDGCSSVSITLCQCNGHLTSHTHTHTVLMPQQLAAAPPPNSHTVSHLGLDLCKDDVSIRGGEVGIKQTGLTAQLHKPAQLNNRQQERQEQPCTHNPGEDLR